VAHNFNSCIVSCRNAGSALLLKPQRIKQVVQGMSTILSCPLTVKLRRGYYDGSDVAHTILPHMASWGAAAATLHGRSRQQRYPPPPRPTPQLRGASTGQLLPRQRLSDCQHQSTFPNRRPLQPYPRLLAWNSSPLDPCHQVLRFDIGNTHLQTCPKVEPKVAQVQG